MDLILKGSKPGAGPAVPAAFALRRRHDRPRARVALLGQGPPRSSPLELDAADGVAVVARVRAGRLRLARR